MLTTLRPGDVVITAKLDRMFRSAADALGTLEEIKDQGVALHMIDLGAMSAATASASLYSRSCRLLPRTSATESASAFGTSSAIARRNAYSTVAAGLSGTISTARAKTGALSRTSMSKTR